MEGLLLDIDLWGAQLIDKKLVSIYFGGGTPSLIGAESIAILLDKVRSYLPFNNHDIEITLEANPETLTFPLMHAYAEAGINRVSIGVQSLDDQLLAKLGRTHHALTAINGVETTLKAGIENISIDLMYDIPCQTLSSWQETLGQISRLPITHLSLYNLTIEPHTVFFKYRESLQKELPDAESSAQMYQNAIDVLTNCGLNQYEISAFARNDLYSKHNVGYWTARPFIGFGPSAFSYWEGRRFRAIANLNRYVQALREKRSPEDFSETLSPERHRRELLAIALRLLKGVDLDAFETEHGLLDSCTYDSLLRLQQQGLMTLNNDKIVLTQKGILFYDTVATDIV